MLHCCLQFYLINILWMAKEKTEVLAGKANCWCIYNGQYHFDIVHDNSVEQPFIACQQVHQIDVLVQVRCTSLNVQQCYLDLIFLSENCWRQETMDLQQPLLTHCITPTLA